MPRPLRRRLLSLPLATGGALLAARAHWPTRALPNVTAIEILP